MRGLHNGLLLGRGLHTGLRMEKVRRPYCSTFLGTGERTGVLLGRVGNLILLHIGLCLGRVGDFILLHIGLRLERVGDFILVNILGGWGTSYWFKCGERGLR